METWAILVLVLGTSIITHISTRLLTDRQLKHSDKRLERQIEAQREEEQHKRRWEVRSQPLLKLRAEIARMVEKIEFSVDLATQVIDGVTPNLDKTIKVLDKTVKDWNAYIESGELYQALHMQYEHKLKVEVHEILRDYQSAYSGVMAFWRGGKADEEIREVNAILKRNAARISSVQSKINEMLEEL